MTTANTKNTIENSTFSIFEIGDFKSLSQYIYDPQEIPGTFPGKLFLKEPLDLSSMEVSFNTMPAGSSMPFHHAHRSSEELFICLSGRGEMIVDETKITLVQGTSVRIAPEAVRIWRNCGTEELQFIVVQGKVNSFDDSCSSDGYAVKKEIKWE